MQIHSKFDREHFVLFHREQGIFQWIKAEHVFLQGCMQKTDKKDILDLVKMYYTIKPSLTNRLF